MKNNYTNLLLGVVIGLLLGLGLAKLLFSPKKENTVIAQSSNSTSQNSSSKENDRNNRNKNNQTTEYSSSSSTEIPSKVYKVLEYVKANGRPMEGYVGGRVFQNREKQLPKEDNNGNAIQYQEWDVNPKVEGKNRGAERMVTGSDGRSWFTNDHYRTFVEIK